MINQGLLNMMVGKASIPPYNGVAKYQLIAANNTVIYKSADGGQSWSVIAGYYGDEVKVCGNGSLMFIRNSSNLYKSTNYGVSWSDITPSLGGTSGILYGFATSDDGNYMTIITDDYNTASYYMMYSTTNGGSTWTNCVNDYNYDYKRVVITRDANTAVYGISGYSGFTTWNFNYLSIYGWGGSARYVYCGSAGNIRAHAVSNNGYYITAVTKGGYIYSIQGDVGGTYTERATSQQWQDVAMSGDGQYQTAVIASGYIYRSADYGVNWTQVGSSASWRRIDMSENGSVQMAVTYGDHLYRSTDYGANWSQVILANAYSVDISVSN